MMQGPVTYADWMNLLKAFADGVDDEHTLALMQNGQLAWQDGVAERFTNRFVDAINARLERASNIFQEKMKRPTSEKDLIQALLALRKSLSLLVKATQISALPPEQQQAYRKLLLEQADKIQKSLMDSAKSEHTGKLSSIVRNHPVNRF